MRRSTPEVDRVEELYESGGRALLEKVGAEGAISVLEPLATEARRARLTEVIARRLDSVTVVLDAPYDPHNGAAVLRCCDAFAIQRLHVIERHEPFLAARSVARGSQKWVDLSLYPESAPLVGALAGRGFELIAAEPDGELVPRDLRDVPRLALVIGNEREGVAPDLLRHCRGAVRVPMHGFVESLNLSVSTAILLSAAIDGRPGDLPEAERTRLYARGLYLSVPRASEVLRARFGIA